MNPDLDLIAPQNESSESKSDAGAEVPKKTRRPRGFAAMDRNRVSEIASKGGKAAHKAGTAHQFTSDEARAAGRKGGVAPHIRRGRTSRSTSSSPPAAPPPKDAQSA